MKKININNVEYELIEDFKNGFDQKEAEKLITDYYEEYDYILGDWSYGKLRLKGFCINTNQRFNQSNNFKNVKDYIKNYCAYECKYFIIKKES
ncbi:MAG: YutD-like domain-containing protein [Bacilli bacterium]